jgi:hypothetical protein
VAAHGHSFPYNIGASLGSYPDFMHTLPINVHSITHAKCLLPRVRLFGIRYCELAIEDQMGGKATVRVGRIIRVSAARHKLVLGDIWMEAYGPSVHVKAFLNPQVLTSSSACFCDL